jgi:alpha-L-fucosidase
MTMNDTWGFKSTDHNWKSSEMLIHNLVDIVSKGGNYLLNVGPTAEGLIPKESVDRLADMGEWMRVNGEAVYGSRLWDHYKDGERVRYTHPEGPYVYAISLGWPGEELVLTRVQPAEGSEVVLLGSSAEIPWSTANDSTTLHVPASLQPERSRPGKYAYAFRIEPR